MIKFDVALVGNVIVDNIHCVSNFQEGASNKSLSFKTCVGSIANVLRILFEIEPKLKINICSTVGEDPHGHYASQWFNDFKTQNSALIEVNINTNPNTPTSTALIVSDIDKNIRSSIVRWGACTQMSNFVDTPALWTHIMYADKLDKLDANVLKAVKKGGIISMDFCLGEHSDEKIDEISEMLKHVDYAILSIDEARSIAKEERPSQAAKKIGNLAERYAIIHSPEYVYVSDGNDLHVMNTNFIEDKRMNVLGAGDIFAASLIAKTLTSDNIVANAQFAHQFTTQKIVESYE